MNTRGNQQYNEYRRGAPSVDVNTDPRMGFPKAPGANLPSHLQNPRYGAPQQIPSQMLLPPTQDARFAMNAMTAFSRATISELVQVPEELSSFAADPQFQQILLRVKEQTMINFISLNRISENCVESIAIDAPNRESAQLARSLIETHFKMQLKLRAAETRLQRVQTDLFSAQGEIASGMMVEFFVPPDLIGLVIGKKGVRINQVQSETGVTSINVNGDTGRVMVMGPDSLSVQRARELLEVQEDLLELKPEHVEWLSNRYNLGFLGDIKMLSNLMVARVNSERCGLTIVGMVPAIRSAKLMLATQIEYMDKQIEIERNERAAREKLYSVRKQYGIGYGSSRRDGGEDRDGRDRRAPRERKESSKSDGRNQDPSRSREGGASGDAGTSARQTTAGVARGSAPGGSATDSLLARHAVELGDKDKDKAKAKDSGREMESGKKGRGSGGGGATGDSAKAPQGGAKQSWGELMEMGDDEADEPPKPRVLSGKGKPKPLNSVGMEANNTNSNHTEPERESSRRRKGGVRREADAVDRAVDAGGPAQQAEQQRKAAPAREKNTVVKAAAAAAAASSSAPPSKGPSEAMFIKLNKAFKDSSAPPAPAPAPAPATVAQQPVAASEVSARGKSSRGRGRGKSGGDSSALPVPVDAHTAAVSVAAAPALATATATNAGAGAGKAEQKNKDESAAGEGAGERKRSRNSRAKKAEEAGVAAGVQAAQDALADLHIGDQDKAVGRSRRGKGKGGAASAPSAAGMANSVPPGLADATEKEVPLPPPSPAGPPVAAGGTGRAKAGAQKPRAVGARAGDVGAGGDTVTVKIIDVESNTIHESTPSPRTKPPPADAPLPKREKKGGEKKASTGSTGAGTIVGMTLRDASAASSNGAVGLRTGLAGSAAVGAAIKVNDAAKGSS